MSGESVIKIAVVGPESTGKSTISAQLAEHYSTIWVPEYAREYCANLKEPCTRQDEMNIFYGQLALEKSLIPLANKVLICDTMFLTVKIWCDYTFGETPGEVIHELSKHTYDLYLLMDIDLPWQEDPLRDFPHEREYFMEKWLMELNTLNANYSVISGNYDIRLHNAINVVNDYLSGLS